MVTVFHHSSASGTRPSPLTTTVSSGCPVASLGHRNKGCRGDHNVQILLARSSHLQILTAFFPKSSWCLMRSPPTMHLCGRHRQATTLPRLPFHTHPQPEKLRPRVCRSCRLFKHATGPPDGWSHGMSLPLGYEADFVTCIGLTHRSSTSLVLG